MSKKKCPDCQRPQRECECDFDLAKYLEPILKLFPADTPDWMCRYCKGTHSDDVACEAKKEVDKRIEEHNREHLRHSLEDPSELPRKATIVRAWVAYGLKCVIVNTEWVFAAYVHLPDGHPDEHKTYDELDRDVPCHGGFGFRQKAVEGGSWFGFDFAHPGDWVAMPPSIGDHPGKMWEVEEVAKEVEEVAKQLASRAA